MNWWALIGMIGCTAYAVSPWYWRDTLKRNRRPSSVDGPGVLPYTPQEDAGVPPS